MSRPSDDLRIAYRSTHQLQTRPWKNGRGLTREIIVVPPSATMADFHWRFSVADIERDGEFSVLAGIDRYFTLIRGGRLCLEDQDTGLQQYALQDKPTTFSGDQSLFAYLGDGPAQAANLMLRRSWGRAQVEVLHHNDATSFTLSIPVGASALFYVIDGEYRLNLPASITGQQERPDRLATGDTLHLHYARGEKKLVLPVEALRPNARLFTASVISND